VFAHDGADGSEPVAVEQQCERVVRSFRAVAGDAAVLQTRFEAGAGFVLPAATLERVLSNLLENALAYGAPPVVVETARTPAGYTLTVRDHGSGIAAHDLINASRPFVRLDPARGGNGHSGLGLAIVERIVRRAGGSAEIGNSPDGGLCVRMTFPFDVVGRQTAQAANAWGEGSGALM